jgi:uncharacterized repeat protein (TIGR04076 family)
MAETYDVEVSVISQKGVCGCGHKVGDKWIMGGTTPAGFCSAAFVVLYPNIRVYRFGGILPWTKDPDVCQLACSDDENPVVFQLKRIKKK